MDGCVYMRMSMYALEWVRVCVFYNLYFIPIRFSANFHIPFSQVSFSFQFNWYGSLVGAYKRIKNRIMKIDNNFVAISSYHVFGDRLNFAPIRSTATVSMDHFQNGYFLLKHAMSKSCVCQHQHISSLPLIMCSHIYRACLNGNRIV